MQSQPELRNLGSFVAVAEELQFTRAAQRLHLTQQTLSAQIRQLETSLGVTLFDRTTRKVELTDAGRRLLGHAVPLLTAAARAWEDVAQPTPEGDEHLSLSYAPTVRRNMLPMLLHEFLERHPTVKVRSAEIWWGDAPLLEDGLIEVTITRSQPSEDDDDLLAFPIFTTPLGLILGSSHPLAQAPTVSIADLGSEALKLWARPFSPKFHDTIVSALRDAGFTGPVQELVIFGSGLLMDDPAALAEIAQGDAFGIGFAGQYTGLGPDLVWRKVEPEVPIPMFLCWRRDASPTVRSFVTTTLDVAQSLDWLDETARDEAERLLATLA